MRVVKSRDFTAKKAWGALDIATIEGASIRLHWTDKPYIWHINDGDEVFAVMDGMVEMHYREGTNELKVKLHTGDIFYANIGTEHVARPIGAARILVIEKKGSV